MKLISVCFGTPPILKFSQWPFRNRFCFGCSFKQKKVVHFWKKYFRFFSCTGLISHQWLDFCLACSGPAACLQRAQGVKSSLICCSCHIESIKKYLWWKKLHLKSPKMGPIWPRNHCEIELLLLYQPHYTMASGRKSQPSVCASIRYRVASILATLYIICICDCG